jgi:hypothetical protein
MGYKENFEAAIVLNSVADNYDDAIHEWVCYGDEAEETEYELGRCCCGHKIVQNLIARNKKNSKTIIVGNCCIKKFGVKRKHFNGSKKAFLELGIELADSPGVRDYLKYETVPRIREGRKFTEKDIEILEKVTGQVSRFSGDPDRWVMNREARAFRQYIQHKINRKTSLFDF